LIVAITFFSGINLFFLGIIGEYVGRVYEEAKGRPHYVVLKVIHHEAKSRDAENDERPPSRALPVSEANRESSEAT